MATEVLWVTAAVVGFLICWFVAGNWLAEYLFRAGIYIPFWLDVVLLGPAGWLLLALCDEVIFPQDKTGKDDQE